jgi:hypothetical protein
MSQPAAPDAVSPSRAPARDIRLVLGTMSFGDTADLVTARAVIDYMLEAGITEVDTANTYGEGALAVATVSGSPARSGCRIQTPRACRRCRPRALRAATSQRNQAEASPKSRPERSRYRVSLSRHTLLAGIDGQIG